MDPTKKSATRCFERFQNIVRNQFKGSANKVPARVQSGQNSIVDSCISAPFASKSLLPKPCERFEK
jgi:hypothetical protein